MGEARGKLDATKLFTVLLNKINTFYCVSLICITFKSRNTVSNLFSQKTSSSSSLYISAQSQKYLFSFVFTCLQGICAADAKLSVPCLSSVSRKSDRRRTWCKEKRRRCSEKEMQKCGEGHPDTRAAVCTLTVYAQESSEGS